MKKGLLIIISSMLLIFIVGCTSINESSLFYTESVEVDNFFISINETANCCFVGNYEYDGEESNKVITVPDEYNGIPITQIGGYYGTGVPTPFQISLCVYMNTDEDSKYHGIWGGDIEDYNLEEEYTIVDVPFVLNIGKNIKSVKYVSMDEYYPYINEDESITFFHPVVEINCSEENEYFYSKEGRLYSKKDDKLISDFAYIK